MNTLGEIGIMKAATSHCMTLSIAKYFPQIAVKEANSQVRKQIFKNVKTCSSSYVPMVSR